MKLLDRVIQYSFYALFILVPLILTPYNYELFEFNKMLTVYFFSVIIGATWIIKMILSKKILLKRTPFDIPLALFLVSQVISTILSTDPHTSVWGYYSRFHGGLLSTISYLILYYAYTARTVLDRRPDGTSSRDSEAGRTVLNGIESSEPSNFTKNSIKVILSTGLIVSIYGILEHFGIDKHLWVQDVQNRVFSTLGQPNWLAAYLICLSPLAWYQFLKNSQDSPEWNLFTLRGGFLAYLTSLIFYLTLIFTKSRSGLLGYSATFILFWGLTLLKKRPKAFPAKKFFTLSLALAITTLIIGTPYTPKVSEFRTPRESSEPSNYQISDLGPPAIATGGSKSSDIRKVVWRGGLAIWRHYPVFGSGVETFAYSYYNHRPIEHNLLSEWDFLYNKAHNEFLNLLATTGVFGLLSYLLIIISVAIYSLKNLKVNPLAPALLSAYLGLAVSNFFGFSVVPVALFFFLFPAMAMERSVLEAKLRGRTLKDSSDISHLRRLTIALVTLITLYLLYSIITLWRADRIFNLGRNYFKANQIQAGYQYALKATELSPKEPLFRNQLAEASAKLAVLYDQSEATNSSKIRDQLINDSITQSDLVLSQNQVHLNFHKSKIKIYLMLATIDQKYYQQVLDAMLDAIDLAPTDAKLYYNLGLLYSKIGQTGLAEQALKETVSLKSNYEAARYALGSLYQQTNRPDLAREQYEYILERLNPENLTVKDKLQNL